MLAAASIVIGLASGTAEVVQFAYKAKNNALGFGEGGDTPGEGGSMLVLVVAILVSLLGFFGARLIRRRPWVASALLAGGAVAGLAAVAIGGMNWLLVALSCLLLAGAACSALSALPRRRVLTS
jgi:hypothetical protein